jgi:hypothetical protein
MMEKNYQWDFPMERYDEKRDERRDKVKQMLNRDKKTNASMTVASESKTDAWNSIKTPAKLGNMSFAGA